MTLKLSTLNPTRIFLIGPTTLPAAVLAHGCLAGVHVDENHSKNAIGNFQLPEADKLGVVGYMLFK